MAVSNPNEYGYFWNSEDGDRIYDGDSVSDFLTPFFTNGVSKGTMEVTPNGGMRLQVAPGYAFAETKVRNFYNQTLITLDIAHSEHPRIDLVVVRFDFAGRQVVLDKITGTAAATPEAPALTRNESTYELQLCKVSVAAGATEITAANITDTRSDTTVCGFVIATGLEEIESSMSDLEEIIASGTQGQVLGFPTQDGVLAPMDVSGGGGGVIPVDPDPEPTEDGSIWTAGNGLYFITQGKVYRGKTYYTPRSLSWANDPLEEILEALESHYMGFIDIKELINIGDTREISIQNISMKIYQDNSEKTVQVISQDNKLRIVNKGGRFLPDGQECAFVFAFVYGVTWGGMSSSGSCVKWDSNTIKNSFNDTLKNAFDSLFQERMKKTISVVDNGTNTEDYLFLPSSTEVLGATELPAEGSQFTYYQTPANRILYYPTGVATPNGWWTRSLHNSSYMVTIANNGNKVNKAPNPTGTTNYLHHRPHGCL